MAAFVRGFWIALIVATSQLCSSIALAQGTVSAAATIAGNPNASQSTTTFQLPECPVVTPALRQQVLDATNGANRCKIRCSGCGCKGGPGYRESDSTVGVKGQCVGYKNILSICGPPPHALCHRECAKIVAVCKTVQTVKKPRKGTKSGAETSPRSSSAIPQSQQTPVQTGTPTLTAQP